ncbi:MAG: hypothetical protein J1E31_00050 [Helicobacter sp.]|nr:hypothetical protein [Helicobacter sp.]
MKGKILGLGAISGDDGKRYYYEEGELKNLKEGQNIEGLEVDFDIVGEKAVQVFVIHKAGFSSNFGALNTSNLPSIDSQFVFLNLNEAKSFLFAPNIHSMKIFALLTLVCYFLFSVFSSDYSENVAKNTSNAPFYIFGILTCLLGLWVNFSLFKLSNDKAPLKYFILSAIIAVIFNILFDSMIKSAALMLFGGQPPYFKMILIFMLLIASLLIIFLWYRKVSQITNEKFFMWSLYAEILSQICFIIFIVALFNNELDPSTWHDFYTWINVLSIVLFALAWLKFREIRIKN